MLGQSGIQEWKYQRLSAIYLAFFSLFLLIFILRHPQLSHAEWQALFSHPFMQIASLFALMSLFLHAWIGLCIVLTDYVKTLFVRYLLQVIILFSLLGYVIWGIQILWGK